MTDPGLEGVSVTSKLDARRSHFLSIFGRKGSGKSILAQAFWDTWPGDRLCIDPTGDVWSAVQHDGETHKLEDPLPIRLRAGDTEHRESHVYVPEPGDAAYEDNLDRAVGLAYNRRGSLLWIDEAGELTRANKTPAHLRRVLRQGRHRDLTALFVNPRPIDIDTLLISQADYVYTFRLPHPRDRERLAGTVGIEPADLETSNAALKPYEYLRFDMRADDEDPNRVLHFPKLPDSLVAKLKAGSPPRR